MSGSGQVGEAQLHLVDDDSGKRATFGDVQAAWLLEQGMVERVGYQQTGPGGAICTYKALEGRTVEEINDAVMGEPSIRECDFCRALPTAWKVNVEPFRITQGPTPAPFTRPVFCCDECAALVRDNDKDALIERMIESTYRKGLALGGQIAAQVRAMSAAEVRKNLGPATREFVRLVISNRRGFPVKADS